MCECVCVSVSVWSVCVSVSVWVCVWVYVHILCSSQVAATELRSVMMCLPSPGVGWTAILCCSVYAAASTMCHIVQIYRSCFVHVLAFDKTVRVMPESLNFTTFMFHPGPTNLVAGQTSSCSLVCPRLLYYTDLLRSTTKRMMLLYWRSELVVTSAVNHEALMKLHKTHSHDHYVTVMWPVLKLLVGDSPLLRSVFNHHAGYGQKVTQPQHCVLNSLALSSSSLNVSSTLPTFPCCCDRMSWSCYPGL